MIELILIGTNHLDLKGPERLIKLLNHYKPVHIWLEFSHEAAVTVVSKHFQQNKIEKAAKSLEKIFGKDGVNNILTFRRTVGYEAWVPCEYKELNPITEIVCLGDESNEKLITKMECKVSKGNKSSLLDFITKVNKEEYQRFIDGSYLDNHLDDIEEVSIMDEDIESNLRYMAKIVKADIKVFYIGGASHFFGDYLNLYERLKELNPKRIRLLEADKL